MKNSLLKILYNIGNQNLNNGLFKNNNIVLNKNHNYKAEL